MVSLPPLICYTLINFPMQKDTGFDLAIMRFEVMVVGFSGEQGLDIGSRGRNRIWDCCFRMVPSLGLCMS